MKKFLSLMIALILVLSLFAVNVVAFADDAVVDGPDTEQGNTGDNDQEGDEEPTPREPVIFHADKFKEYVSANHPFNIEMSKTFMLNLDWLDDADKVNEIFENINYVLEDEEDEADEPEATAEDDEESDDENTDDNTSDDDEVVVPNDVFYVLYCSPSDAPQADMKDWSHCVATGTFSVTTDGYWLFRFAVVDGAKASEKNYTFDWADVLATSYDNVQNAIDDDDDATDPDDEENLTLVSSASDTTNPVVSLSSSMETKQQDGLTVGTNYSISTSLNIEDCSSTTVTYVVYKKVGAGVEGADNEGWLQIYDSSKTVSSERVTEGFEDNISTSGVITPLEEDVTGEYVYKIVYTVKDSAGYYGVDDDGELFNPVLMLKVNAKEVTSEEKAIEAWKIVLYVIAGLSAVGIVVLLCIRPKQQKADARYNASVTEASSEESADESDK